MVSGRPVVTPLDGPDTTLFIPPHPSVGGTGALDSLPSRPQRKRSQRTLETPPFFHSAQDRQFMPWTFANSHVSSHARAQAVVARCSCGRDLGSEFLEIGNWKCHGSPRQTTKQATNKHHKRRAMGTLTKREIRGHRRSRYCRAGSKARRHWMPILTAPQWQATSRRCPGSPLDTTSPSHPPMCLFMLDLSVRDSWALHELAQVLPWVGMPRDDASRRRQGGEKHQFLVG